MPPDPTILAFDTSAAHCAAALLSGGSIVGSRVEAMQKGQAERLFGILEELLSAHGKTFSDLDAIGVGTGPGNFTGIRIAVSAARGLAMGLDIPAIGVNGFEARAFGASAPVSCLISAPRGQVYRQDVSENSVTKPVLQDGDEARKAARANGFSVIETTDAKAITQNIAQIAASRFGAEPGRPAPMYVRPPDAAPSKHVAPKIIA